MDEQASDRERWLPLFPLNTVLFPGGTMPLYIFEERYKLMMQDCLESDRRLGIVLIKSGEEVGEPAVPHSTGTMGQVTQAAGLKDGRILVSVVGKQRFSIRRITQSRPYLAADVELLEEDADAGVPPTEMEAIRRAVSHHVTLAAGLRGGWRREANLAENPAGLSYFIAGILFADVKEKQALLEESSPSKRLEMELDLLRRETEVLRRRVDNELRSRFSRQ